MATKRIQGFSNIHYAKLLQDTIEGAKYETPKPLEGAISISAEMEFSEFKAFADDRCDILINNFTGLSGEVVLSGITGAEFKDLFGYEYEQGLTKVKTDAIAPNLALMFETKFLDGGVRKYVLYNIVMSPASALELQTKGEDIEETTFTINFTGIALANDEIYSFIDSRELDVDTDALDNWYTQVQGITTIPEE